MKLVTFTRDMRPHVAGETRVVPDDVAARLVASGDAAPDPPTWPAETAENTRPRKPQRYLTK